MRLAERWFGKATAEDGRVVPLRSIGRGLRALARNGFATGHYAAWSRSRSSRIVRRTPLLRFAGGLTIVRPDRKPRLLHDEAGEHCRPRRSTVSRRWFGEGPWRTATHSHLSRVTQRHPWLTVWGNWQSPRYRSSRTARSKPAGTRGSPTASPSSRRPGSQPHSPRLTRRPMDHREGLGTASPPTQSFPAAPPTDHQNLKPEPQNLNLSSHH